MIGMSTDNCFTLYCRGVAIGTVRWLDADFPNCYGEYEAVDGCDQPELRRRLERYIAYSVESMRLLDEGDMEAYDALLRERDEALARPLVDEEWVLVDRAGEHHPILIPIFHVDEEIVWRWKPAD